jgi:Ion transport protein
MSALTCAQSLQLAAVTLCAKQHILLLQVQWTQQCMCAFNRFTKPIACSSNSMSITQCYTRQHLHLLTQVLLYIYLCCVCSNRGLYFKDNWNRFDFFVVIGTAAGIIAQLSVGGTFGSAAMVIRTFRIGRILRLVRGLESMSELFSTLLLTLPSLGNVGALLFLLFFIYSG